MAQNEKRIMKASKSMLYTASRAMMMVMLLSLSSSLSLGIYSNVVEAFISPSSSSPPLRRSTTTPFLVPMSKQSSIQRGRSVPSASSWTNPMFSPLDFATSTTIPSLLSSRNRDKRDRTSMHLFRDFFRRGGEDDDKNNNKKKDDDNDTYRQSSSVAVADKKEEDSNNKQEESSSLLPFFVDAAEKEEQVKDLSLKERTEETTEVDVPEKESTRGEEKAPEEEESMTEIIAEETKGTTDTTTKDEQEASSSSDSEEEKSAGDSKETPSSPKDEEQMKESQSSSSSSTTASPSSSKKSDIENMLEEAKALKAAAERARLEAEKMDAMLTLEKIARLEKELGSKSVAKDPDRAKQIRNEIEILQKKLRGEDQPPRAKGNNLAAASSSSTTTTLSPSTTKSSLDSSWKSSTKEKKDETSTSSTMVTMKKKVLSPEELEKLVSEYEESPRYLREIIARMAGMMDETTTNNNDVDRVNTTKLVLKLYQEDDTKMVEPSFSFTPEQIQAKLDELKMVPNFVKDLVQFDEENKNDTALAVQLLKKEAELARIEKMKKEKGMGKKKSKEKKESGLFGWGGGSRLFGGDGGSDVGDDVLDKEEKDMINMVESLFPKSMREEGEVLPTEAEVEALIADVLTKTNGAFSPSGRPEPVPGGFLIRGTSKFDDEKKGEMVIKAIGDKLRTSRLRNRLNVFFVYDPTPVTEEQMQAGERPPVLYVTGPKIVGDRNRFLLAGVSSIGLATSWYMSIYPFLLNPDFMKKAEEQVALADASMASDMSFLTDRAWPLYLTFLGIQVAHEIGHRVVANANQMNITFPTLVPSLVSGITSSITALKEPPKNKQALLDFAIAGPLAGMIVSILVLLAGLELTAFSDAQSYAALPALPIDFLRQSSLGGGIIEFILGPGTLDVPDGAASMRAISNINIPLHPVAIAGYISLVVNALNLLPFGRTDGGRIGLALFGRSGIQLVGLITLLGLFAYGLFRSDICLFYFSFLLFFQNDPEIPMRNEVDSVDFSRVLFSTLSGVLVLLTLIPM